MVTGPELAEELKCVDAPAEGGFSVRPVAVGYKVGRGTDGVVALLTPPDQQPDPPTRLRSLSLDPRVRCRLDNPDGSSVEEEHGVVQLRLVDEEVLEPFLDVAAAVVRLLGPSPAPGEVSAGMRRLVRIFERAEPPRGSVLGLWGELMVIDRCSDPAAMVDAWHAHVDARFDFSAEGSRLEAKTTTRDARVHQFNLRQLKPVVGAETRVVSMMTTETRAGTAVGELVQRIEGRLAGDAVRQIKVHELVAATLGSDWARHVGRRFDERQAVESVVVLDPAGVPQVDDPMPAVLEVHLTVDCTDVPAAASRPGLSGLIGSATNEPGSKEE